MAQRVTTPRKGASSKRTGARSRPTGRRAKTAPVSEARTTREDDTLPQHAKEAQGRPLSDFLLDDDEVEALGLTRSEGPFGKVEIYRLSDRDHEAITESLINPPEQTPTMKRAIERQRKWVQVE